MLPQRRGELGGVNQSEGQTMSQDRIVWQIASPTGTYPTTAVGS